MSPVAAAAPRQVSRLADQLRLPVLLLLALSFGVCWPGPGAAAGRAGGISSATSLVFLVTGLALKPADVKEAWSAKGAALFAAASTLLLSPLLALPLLEFAPRALPSLPAEFAAGLAAMLCSACGRTAVLSPAAHPHARCGQCRRL
jgi:predicted Na+-dependent transporter